ncbi:LLM class flavin-dependent oxidoreductase [bacterium]|nr:LLM class flavin-dependent oxidoreductase [bacterium]MBP3846470.1 LLM class flavin-dependent oxidoreductase [bacterium]
MEFSAKDLVKLLISKENMTQKELVSLLNEKTDKSYTPDGLSRKLNRGTITFNEVSKIISILGYCIKLDKQ